MYIHEAINSTTKKKPFITRKAWFLVETQFPIIRILPTSTPDCCLMTSDYSSRGPCRGWQPRSDDLVADDWVICSGSLSSKSAKE